MPFLVHKVSMSTADAAKWKCVLYLDACPERSRAAPSGRDIELTLALSSPAKTCDESGFHEFVKRRVDTDAANLVSAKFESWATLSRQKTAASPPSFQQLARLQSSRQARRHSSGPLPAPSSTCSRRAASPKTRCSFSLLIFYRPPRRS